MSVRLNWSAHDNSIAATLAAAGLELDQRMAVVEQLRPSTITGHLQATNARLFHLLPHLPVQYGVSFSPAQWIHKIVALGAAHARDNTFGATDYLRGLILHAREHPSGYERSAPLDRIVTHFGGSSETSVNDLPELVRLLDRVDARISGADDWTFTLIGDREDRSIRFRIVSELDDYYQQNENGLLIPHKGLLTHFGDLGLFTVDSIAELEALINDPQTREGQFQEFFERYPFFLRQNDYREVHPHTYLTREGDGPLVPDFILTNLESQRAAVVELKRARALRRRLIRHQDNRVRFADAVMEARAQLLTYQEWFDLPANRSLVAEKVGMEIYRPAMMVIIGRASDFTSGLERQRLNAHVPDLKVVTYDDILHEAQRRRIVLEG